MTMRPFLSASPPSRARATRTCGALACALAALTACGSGGAKAPSSGPVVDASVDAAAPRAPSPPPSGLPPMAAMPPPGVAGSKKATLRLDASLTACSGAAKVQGKDPTDLVKQTGEGCATASKMKPVSSVLRGVQSDGEAHQESRFRAEANHCYRVYFAGDASAKDVVVVLRDSAGDVVGVGPAPAVPEEGVACFTASDDVSVLVGVGSGKGAWAAQIWGD